MSALVALLLFAAAPASPVPVAAEAPARSSATTTGIARARIVSPVRVRLAEDGDLATDVFAAGPRMLTHQQVRRDGARVIDCY